MIEASKTTDFEKVKHVFKEICENEQQIKGVDRKILSKFFINSDQKNEIYLGLIKKMKERLNELSGNLFKIAKSTSLYDIKERKEFLTRVLCNIHVFEEYILNFIDFIPSSEKIETRAGKNALKCLESFFSIELLLN